jgi:hypothetical protein
MSLSSFSSEQLTLGEKFTAKGGRSGNTWDGILKFYHFCVEMHFCQVFLYRIYEVDLLQGQDILNVKSPNFSQLSKTVLPPPNKNVYQRQIWIFF